MLIDDLATPTLLVEDAHLRVNLDRMQARAAAHNVALRPHVKTHKSVRIAQMQTEAGAAGLTASKPSEAAPFVEAGLRDVFLAYPVAGHVRVAEVRALAVRARLTLGVDTKDGAEALSAAFEDAPVDVRVELDCGHHRTGRREHGAELAEFARFVAGLPGLRLAGLFTHEGHAYAGPRSGETALDARRRVMTEARERLLGAADALLAEGLATPGAFDLSMGSTPTATAFENRTSSAGFRITELRPGNYVFRDAQQVALGSATLEDCALTVLTSVVSIQTDDLGQQAVFFDAGKKVFTSDGGYGTTGYGIPLYNPRTMRELPHLRLTALSEEHGWAEVHGTFIAGVGDRIRIVPNHACVTVATQERMFLVRGDEVVEELRIDARDGVR
ncbi:MAG: alanine racemase [Rhodothermales bacterium]|nr:alanine racemase [Rhodothermales bacterium]